MAVTYMPPNYPRIVYLVLAREAASKLASPWFFLVATAVCLMAFIYGSGFQSTFSTESVLVTSDPLAALHIMIVVFLGLVLGLRLATALSWEREHRTLEVLLVGPVPLSAVLAAKFLVEVFVLAALIAIYWFYMMVGQPLGAGVISPADSLSILQMPVFALPVMGLGLLVSCWALTVRAAVVVYLVVVVMLAAYEGLLGVLRALPAEEMSLAALYFRAGLEAASPIVGPLSPAAHLADMMERMFAQAPAAAMQVASAMGLTAILLLIGYFVARARGAQV